MEPTLEDFIARLVVAEWSGRLDLKLEAGHIRSARRQLRGYTPAGTFGAARKVAEEMQELRSRSFYGDVTIEFNLGTVGITNVTESVRLR